MYPLLAFCNHQITIRPNVHSFSCFPFLLFHGFWNEVVGDHSCWLWLPHFSQNLSVEKKDTVIFAGRPSFLFGSAHSWDKTRARTRKSRHDEIMLFFVVAFAVLFVVFCCLWCCFCFLCCCLWCLVRFWCVGFENLFCCTHAISQTKQQNHRGLLLESNRQVSRFHPLVLVLSQECVPKFNEGPLAKITVNISSAKK